ncbi:hypothetical protein [Ancylomarina longa]|uniref:Uncharacterized protein n=1 Tax=Ancylomarina longa TaxID=2487017 RepID=A0A434AZX2_9BACT|nr:hypothetical protein [Ancylomarina longa]RUT80168.1 hypothetical protein DLK05_02110 [Ancylomarina longa]
MRIKAKIVQGYGVASGKSGDVRFPMGTIQMQLKYFLERGLDLSNYYRGTLNVDIAPSHFKMVKPKFFIENMKWSKDMPPENFYFFDVMVSVEEEEMYEGLIYMPDPKTKVEHEQKPTVLELMLPKIEDLHYGQTLYVQVKEEQIAIVRQSL